jgi:hypothetical protein
MPELELALADLGRHVEFPPAPELAPRVRARLAEGPTVARGLPRLYGYRRALAIGLAVLAVAVAAVLAVPQTRAAILEFFHLRGVTIERVEELPTVPIQQHFNEVFLGQRVTLEEARDAVHFRVVVPEALGEPDEVYLQQSNPPGGMVSFVYGTKEQPRAILTQFEAAVHDAIFKKVAVGTTIDQVEIDGGPGFWIEGAHVFDYFDRRGEFRQELIRLAGNTLLWERGKVTLRLEADVSEDEAVKIARSVR